MRITWMVQSTIAVALGLALGACQSEVAPPCSGCNAPPIVEPHIVWTAEGFTLTRPVVDEHAVYILGEHVVTAFDKVSGASLWTTPLPDNENTRLGYGTALAAGMLIVGDIDVFGLDPATGVIRWQFAPRTTFPAERSFQRIATDGATVYIGGVWGNVYAVDAATGVQRWIAHVTTLPDSNIRVFNPVIDRGVVYVAFDDTPPDSLVINGGAAAIDASTGRLLWSQFLPRHFVGPTETRSIAVTPTRVVIGNLDGFLYGLHRETGAVVDTVSQTVFGFEAGRSQATVFQLATVGDTMVLATTENGKLTAFDGRALGHPLWQISVPGSPQDLLVDSERAYMNSITLFEVASLATHKILWEFGPIYTPTAESFLGAPALEGDRVYLGGDRHIYALKRP